MCCADWCYVSPIRPESSGDPVLFLCALLFLILGIIALAFVASRVTRRAERTQRSRRNK